MNEKTPRKGPSLAFSSPWVVLGATLILICVVLVMSLVNIHRSRGYISQVLGEKGAALIRAFEAGTITGMRGMLGAGAQIQALLTETADAPDIQFIAVTDDHGKILAHNDPAQVGAELVDSSRFAALNPNRDIKWRTVRDAAGQRSFMVYRAFLPSLRPLAGGPPGPRHPGFGPRRGPRAAGPGPATPGSEAAGTGEAPDAGHGPRRFQPPGHGNFRSDFLCGPTCDPAMGGMLESDSPTYIFVGMNMAPFEAARAEDLRNTILISVILVFLAFGGVVSIFWAHNYRTSRRQLMDARAFSAQVVKSMPVGLVVTDDSGRVAYVNGPAEAMAGVKAGESLGRTPGAILPSAVVELARNSSEKNSVLEREMLLDFGRGGDPMPVDVSVTPITTDQGEKAGELVILRDLREVKRLEAEVRRSERLAAIGSLAAGVAHEIRNPLSSIKGFATYLGGKFAEGSEEKKSAQVMISEADRLNRVISELLEFARPSDLKKQPVSVAELVEHSLKLVTSDAAARNVTIETRGLEEPLRAELDPDRLSQALLNLYLNAIQSMSDKGGVMRVSLSPGPDGHLSLEVSDQGKGIPPRDLDKIFNPYYTTKPTGTGLGLAIVHKIVDAHGGHILVDSEAGKGTSVTVSLPRG